MKEKPQQLNLGLEFEPMSPIEAASISVSRQYFRDRIDGNINREGWFNIANLYPRYRRRILDFGLGVEGAWEEQNNAALDDPRFLETQYVDFEENISSQKSNPYFDWGIQQFSNLSLVHDLFWIRTPYYYSPDDIRDQLDIIYGEITPEVIQAEDDLGDAEHPVLAFIPTTTIIRKILSGDIGLGPSFPPEPEEDPK